MVKLKTRLTLPTVGLSGFEPPLTEEELAIQASVHRFAKEILRPLGAELDRMSADDAVAPGSPYYSVFTEFAKLGLDPELLASLPPEIAARAESLIFEELGWGDSGLCVSLGVSGVPLLIATGMGNQELIGLCQGRIGCVMGTTPDKGTDIGAFDWAREWPAGLPGNKGNLLARIVGDEVVINGQSSAWVSNGPVTHVAVALLNAEYDGSFYDEEGRPHLLMAIVPLDLPGVSRGKPLDKIGQRSLPQGETYFDNVRLPKRFATGLKDEAYGNWGSAWSYLGGFMAQTFTGVARAAFELALAYCHERKQGGKLLIDHQLTRFRIGDMLRRIEGCRAMARRSLLYARTSPQSHPYVTALGKVTVTEEALHVASEALQLFGGAGLSREYPIEKLYRDCRAALIEDGENRMLTTRLGLLAQQLYADGWTRN